MSMKTCLVIAARGNPSSTAVWTGIKSYYFTIRNNRCRKFNNSSMENYQEPSASLRMKKGCGMWLRRELEIKRKMFCDRIVCELSSWAVAHVK